MSFQGNQGEVEPQIGHEIPGAADGAQVVQLTQMQIAQILRNTVSQALTHQIQQIGNIPSSATAVNYVSQTRLQHNSFKHPSSWMYQHSRVIVQQAG